MANLAEREKLIDLYKSRLDFIEELGIESTLDMDAGGMRLKNEYGSERLVTFEEMTLDIDGAIVRFNQEIVMPDTYTLNITITRRNEVVYRVRTAVKNFTTHIGMKEMGAARNELSWTEDDDD